MRAGMTWTELELARPRGGPWHAVRVAGHEAQAACGQAFTWSATTWDAGVSGERCSCAPARVVQARRVSKARGQAPKVVKPVQGSLF
jgi:hypothetical protein